MSEMKVQSSKAVRVAPAARAAKPAPAKAAVAADSFTRTAAAQPAADKEGVYEAPKLFKIPGASAPALPRTQMYGPSVDNDPIQKLIYSLEHKAPVVFKGYQLYTRSVGTALSFVNFGLSAYNTVKILGDKHAPTYLKAGMVGATALTGAAMAGVARQALHAYGLKPLTDAGAQAVGKFSGIAGSLGGFVLSALDTINTFRNPDATAGEKGLSTVATGMTASLALMAILGVGGPFGAIFGIGSLVLTIFKGKLGKIGFINDTFEKIGNAIAPAAEGVKNFFKKIF